MVGLLFGEYARRLVAMARELKQPENLVCAPSDLVMCVVVCRNTARAVCSPFLVSHDNTECGHPSQMNFYYGLFDLTEEIQSICERA